MRRRAVPQEWINTINLLDWMIVLHTRVLSISTDCAALRSLLGKKMHHVLELPFRAGFRTVSGRVVERGGKGSRTAGRCCPSVPYYPVGLGEADTHANFY